MTRPDGIFHPAAAFADFDAACAGVLAYLRDRFGRGLWMVTRTTGDEEVVLRLHGADGAREGQGRTLHWAQVTAGACAAVPLELPDGQIFGSLCVVEPAPEIEPFAHELPAIAMYARLLATILARELEAAHEARRATRAEDAALRDPLTGLPNRRAWDLAIAVEEDRCRRYGAPAAVLSVDVDGLKQVNDEQGHSTGDELLKRVATTMLSGVRRHDVVARIGGDEFSVLLPECPESEARALAARIEQQLHEGGVAASVGCSQRRPDDGGLAAAFERADGLMYERKRSRSAD